MNTYFSGIDKWVEYIFINKSLSNKFPHPIQKHFPRTGTPVWPILPAIPAPVTTVATARSLMQRIRILTVLSYSRPILQSSRTVVPNLAVTLWGSAPSSKNGPQADALLLGERGGCASVIPGLDVSVIKLRASSTFSVSVSWLLSISFSAGFIVTLPNKLVSYGVVPFSTRTQNQTYKKSYSRQGAYNENGKLILRNRANNIWKPNHILRSFLSLVRNLVLCTQYRRFSRGILVTYWLKNNRKIKYNTPTLTLPNYKVSCIVWKWSISFSSSLPFSTPRYPFDFHIIGNKTYASKPCIDNIKGIVSSARRLRN